MTHAEASERVGEGEDSKLAVRRRRLLLLAVHARPMHRLRQLGWPSQLVWRVEVAVRDMRAHLVYGRWDFGAYGPAVASTNQNPNTGAIRRAKQRPFIEPNCTPKRCPYHCRASPSTDLVQRT